MLEPASLTLEAKVFGQRRALFDDWQIPFPSTAMSQVTTNSFSLSLHDLLAWVVQHQVAVFQERQEAQRFTQILTKSQIEMAATTGKITMSGQAETINQVKPPLDEQEAVVTALQAFEDGLFYVFVDKTQYQTLDSQVTLNPGSKLTFIRLIALAGG